MKSVRLAISLLLPLFLLLAATAALAQSAAQKSFDQLKTLTGSWEGKNSMGEPVQVSYKLTAGGSAVMSEIVGHGEDMITMFYLDGPNRLLMTHYCTVGNQPRMQASPSADRKSVTFNSIDGTNLDGPGPGHMQTAVITVLDAGHHTEDWTFAGHDKELKQSFDLRRKM
jgi:hypothetical protein